VSKAFEAARERVRERLGGVEPRQGGPAPTAHGQQAEEAAVAHRPSVMPRSPERVVGLRGMAAFPGSSTCMCYGLVLPGAMYALCMNNAP